MRPPIVIKFVPTSLGRVEFDADVLTSNRLSLESVTFKLDSGSDFTTLSCDDLAALGYEKDFLKSCKFHENDADPAFGTEVPIQYIENVSIKFGDRELQGCRIFFVLDTDLRSLFGSDILKYFNYEVDYEAHPDSGELRLTEREVPPLLAKGETRIYIYSLEAGTSMEDGVSHAHCTAPNNARVVGDGGGRLPAATRGVLSIIRNSDGFVSKSNPNDAYFFENAKYVVDAERLVELKYLERTGDGYTVTERGKCVE